MAKFTFDAWKAEACGPIPSLDKWLKDAQSDYVTMRLVLATMQKTKEEMVALFADSPDEFMAMIEEVADFERRYQAGAKVMSACFARLFVAASAFAVQS